jgi:hypothetical protein
VRALEAAAAVDADMFATGAILWVTGVFAERIRALAGPRHCIRMAAVLATSGVAAMPDEKIC